MQDSLTIEIVSDVSCPWCIIGYLSLQKALRILAEDIDLDVRWHAFELNPAMGKEGQNLVQHVVEKYGLTPDESATNRRMIVEKGAELDFNFNFGPQTKIYNTFDAHRLIHWSKRTGQQTVLKLALFEAYFSKGQDPSNHQDLLDVVEEVGLDRNEAEDILKTDRFKQEVRQEQEFYRQMGIEAVPTFIFNKKYAMTGGQPVEAFERAIADILEKA